LLIVGVGTLALGSASALNLVWSPLRHAFADREGTVPLLSMRPKDDDLLVKAPRVYKVTMMVMGDGPDSPYAAYATKGQVEGDEAPEPALLNGEVLPECEMSTGYDAWFETAAKDLESAGYGGSGVLIADLFTALWLYGDFKPVEGAAPWYYAGAPGIEAADHVLVPLCPTGMGRRADIVKAIGEAGWKLVEERRTDTYILLRPERN